MRKVTILIGNARLSYHGVNRNGNVGTLLYVHGNPEGIYQDSIDCMTNRRPDRTVYSGKDQF